MNGLDLSLKVNGGDRHTYRAPANVQVPDEVGMYCRKDRLI